MDLTTTIHTYLTTAPASHFLGQEVAMLAHWSGRDNLLWRAQRCAQEVVVKLFLDAGQARGRRQFAGQERFAPRGLAPRPLWFDRYPAGLSRQLLVYAWAEGDALEGANPPQMAALAVATAQLHGSDPNQLTRFSPHPVNLDYFWRILRGGLPALQQWLTLRKAEQLAQLLDQLASQAERLVAAALPWWAGSTPTPVHGDLRLENGFSSFGTVTLLDWEFFGLGDPALEVANFLYLHQSDLGAEGVGDWLAHYLAHFEQAGLDQRIGAYGWLLPFQSLCFLLNGLREHGPAAASNAERSQALSFLYMLLTHTLQQTTQQLQIAGGNTDALLRPLFWEMH